MPAPQINWEKLARARTHPMQIDILEVLRLDGGRAMSPNEMSFELQVPLGDTSYHAKQLVEAEMIELASTAQRRGALEHFYRLAPAEVPDAS